MQVGAVHLPSDELDSGQREVRRVARLQAGIRGPGRGWRLGWHRLQKTQVAEVSAGTHVPWQPHGSSMAPHCAPLLRPHLPIIPLKLIEVGSQKFRDKDQVLLHRGRRRAVQGATCAACTCPCGSCMRP